MIYILFAMNAFGWSTGQHLDTALCSNVLTFDVMSGKSAVSNFDNGDTSGIIFTTNADGSMIHGAMLGDRTVPRILVTRGANKGAVLSMNKQGSSCELQNMQPKDHLRTAIFGSMNKLFSEKLMELAKSNLSDSEKSERQKSLGAGIIACTRLFPGEIVVPAALQALIDRKKSEVEKTSVPVVPGK